MGASKDQIVADYMQSYINYFGIEKGTEQYDYIAKDILAMLKVVANTDDLNHANLAVSAKNYLLSGGMTEQQIDALKANLSAAPSLKPAEPEILKTEDAKPAEPELVKVEEAKTAA